MLGSEFREMVRVHGPGPTARKLYELLDKGEIEWSDLSVRELYEALVGPVERTLRSAARRKGFVDIGLLLAAGTPEDKLREAAVDTSTFAVITGSLIAKRVIDAYNQYATIGRSLVTVMRSRHKTERIAGFRAFGGLETVLQGQEYPETGFEEKYVTTEATKKGLTLCITEEMIMEDQTGQILAHAGNIGRLARQEEEQAIIRAITEPAAAYYCYRPAGTAAAMYANDHSAIDGQTNDTLAAGNALVDWTDIQAAELLLTAIVDEAGNPAVVIPKTILVPTALLHTAKYIVNATQVDYGTDMGGTVATTQTTRVMTANTLAAYKIVSSPLIYSTQVQCGVAAGVAASNWWLGDFPAQFTLQEVWPVQVLRRGGQTTELGWKRDVVEEFKTRLYVGVFATDHRYVIESQA